jgi:hypothetical protein
MKMRVIYHLTYAETKNKQILEDAEALALVQGGEWFMTPTEASNAFIAQLETERNELKKKSAKKVKKAEE